MGIDDFSCAQMASRLDAMKNTGGTVDERAWARELSGVLRKDQGISLPEAEHQAWCKVIESRFRQG